jgi:exopolysaccharide biosynthesis WecB/TagA/CpsF family protein
MSTRVPILNIEVDNLTEAEFLAQLTSGVVFTPNINHLVKLQSDRAFYDAYQEAEYRVCDGQVIFLLSRLLGTPFRERLSGSDIFPHFCEYHRQNPLMTVFLLGGRDDASAQAAQQRLNERAGRALVVAAYSPPLGFESDPDELARILQQINNSGASVLAVGVGAPKQELFIRRYRKDLIKVKIFFAIGATIDFEAGTQRRIPEWLMRSGLGFIHRVLFEPRRLWWRYMVEPAPVFLCLLRQRFGCYTDPFARRD